MDLLSDELFRLASLHTYIGEIAAVVFILWHLYRSPKCQEKIPVRMRWTNLSFGWQHALLISMTALSGTLTGLAAGLSWFDAVKAGLAAAQTLVLTNMLSKR